LFIRFLIVAGGETLAEAFAQQALGMWGYMTDLRGVAVDPACTRVVEAHGVDLISLLFAWLDGCLCCYGQDYFVGREVAVTFWGREEGGGGTPGYCIRAIVRGERFEFGKHSQGTEVKAITYSNMQIFAEDGAVYSANDAGDAAAAAAAAGGGAEQGEGAQPAAGAGKESGARGPGGGGGASGGSAEAAPAVVRGARRGPCDIYAIVDI